MKKKPTKDKQEDNAFKIVVRKPTKLQSNNMDKLMKRLSKREKPGK